MAGRCLNVSASRHYAGAFCKSVFPRAVIDKTCSQLGIFIASARAGEEMTRAPPGATLTAYLPLSTGDALSQAWPILLLALLES